MFGPFLGKCRDDLTRPDTRLGLADEETLEPEPRNLPAPLLLDPPAPLLEEPLDVCAGHPLGHGQPGRLTPGNLQPPSARPRRAPHLDRLHGHEPTVGVGDFPGSVVAGGR